MQTLKYQGTEKPVKEWTWVEWTATGEVSRVAPRDLLATGAMVWTND